MEAKGKDLIFIKQIAGDGSELTTPAKTSLIFEQDTTFQLRHLSITNGTFIASAMNTYIVKLKPIPKKVIEMKFQEILSKLPFYKGFSTYEREAIIKDLVQLHKQDVLAACSKGIKLMADTLSSEEADLMADDYYSENFE